MTTRKYWIIPGFSVQKKKWQMRNRNRTWERKEDPVLSVVLPRMFHQIGVTSTQSCSSKPFKKILCDDFYWLVFSRPLLCNCFTMFIIRCSRTLLLRLHNCLYIACSTSKLRSKVCALFSFMFSLCDAFHNCCIWSKPSIFRVSILNIKHLNI